MNCIFQNFNPFVRAKDRTYEQIDISSHNVARIHKKRSETDISPSPPPLALVQKDLQKNGCVVVDVIDGDMDGGFVRKRAVRHVQTQRELAIPVWVVVIHLIQGQRKNHDTTSPFHYGPE